MLQWNLSEFEHTINAVLDPARVKVMLRINLHSLGHCSYAHLLRFLSNWIWLNGSLFRLVVYLLAFLSGIVHLSPSIIRIWKNKKTTITTEKKLCRRRIPKLILNQSWFRSCFFYIFYCDTFRYISRAILTKVKFFFFFFFVVYIFLLLLFCLVL